MPSIRDVFRSIRRSPGLATAAIVCIALGSASTTAVATLTDVALIRALPFPAADRFTRIWIEEPGVDSRQWLSIPEAQDILSARSFDAVLITARVRVVMLLSGGAERLRGEGANANYFQTLGLRPVAGRFMEPGDHVPGTPPVMVLSHGTWLRGFGGDPGVIGRTLRTERASYTVIGVAPQGFTGTVEDDLVEFWIPVEYYEPASIFKDRRVRSTWSAIGQDMTFGEGDAQMPSMPSGTYRVVGVVENVAWDGIAAQDTRRYTGAVLGLFGAAWAQRRHARFAV